MTRADVWARPGVWLVKQDRSSNGVFTFLGGRRERVRVVAGEDGRLLVAWPESIRTVCVNDAVCITACRPSMWVEADRVVLDGASC